MADWALSSARASLRSLLGDGAADHYEFRSVAYPAPDGVTRRFFAGQPRLVEDSLAVYAGSVDVTPAASGVDWTKGEFLLATAPSASVEVHASFYYQWFTDTELDEFLTAGAGLLNYDGVTTVVIGLRGAVLDFACYYAAMRKAMEYADGPVASAQGYQADQSRPSPNWRLLAKQFWDAASEKVKMFVENPASNAGPAMAFVSYRLGPDTPR
jgi:hypothetical protein